MPVAFGTTLHSGQYGHRIMLNTWTTTPKAWVYNLALSKNVQSAAVTRVSNVWTIGCVLNNPSASVILGNVGGTQSALATNANVQVVGGDLRLGMQIGNGASGSQGLIAAIPFSSILTEANFQTLHGAVG